MFFNYDVLFRTGSLALVWLVGTGNYKGRRGKKKTMLEVWSSDVPAYCNTLRDLLPKMGTDEGIPLKKMGVLAKGVSSILLIKVEKFTADVRTTLLVLRQPVVLRDRDPALQPASSRKNGQRSDETGLGNAVVGFEMLDLFNSNECGLGDQNLALPSRRQDDDEDDISGNFNFYHRLRNSAANEGDNQRFAGTPRRGQKRKSVEMESPVRDPRANLLPEFDATLNVGRMDAGPEFDLGDGLAFMAGDNEMPPPPPPPGDNEQFPQPEGVSDFMGIPSTVNQETRNVEETPSAAVTRPVNFKRPRNDLRENEADITVLPPLAEEEGTPQRRRTIRARRRLRLQVDENTSISGQEMRERGLQLRAALDMDALVELMREDQAPPKSKWRMVARDRLSALDFISSAGRQCPSKALSDLVKANMKKQAERRPNPMEEGRDAAQVEMTTDQTTLPGVERTKVNEATANGEMHPTREPEEEPVDLPEVSSAYVVMDFEHGGNQEFDENPVEPPPFPPNDDFFPAPRERSRNKGKRDLTGALMQTIGKGQTFSKLFPPNKCRRAKAARGFVALLKLQAQKKIVMQQRAPWGEIVIKPLQRDESE